MRHIVATGCVGLAVLMAAGCVTQTGGNGIKPLPPGLTTAAEATSTSARPEPATAGAASPTKRPPSITTSAAPPGPVVVTAAKAEAILLSAKDTGKIVGSTFTYESKGSVPGPASPGRCGELAGATDATLGEEWTTYRTTVQQETADAFDHMVWQFVAVYPDVSSAVNQMVRGFPPSLAGCANSLIDLDGPRRVESVNITPTKVDWVFQAIDNGQPTGWRCFFDYRTKNNVIFGARLCQFANGRPALTRIVNEMQKWIPEP